MDYEKLYEELSDFTWTMYWGLNNALNVPDATPVKVIARMGYWEDSLYLKLADLNQRISEEKLKKDNQAVS